MEPSEFQELRERLARVEERLAKLEGTPVPPRYEPAPKPAPAVLVPPPVQVPMFTPAPPVRQTKKPKEDAEYQIGARILPYTGAAVLIIGLAFLVSLAIGRGMITPAMLWWGVDLVSVLFIAAGIWKRNEREQFGQILTAIGSCGLYLNFAAGHFYQHLYQGETLVGLFVVQSLLILGYATWRSSRAFLGLGLLGGIIAALMPLHERNFEANVLLLFIILVPAVVIAARNRWTDASAWIYCLGSLALTPLAVDVKVPDELRVPAILGAALLTIAGWAYGYRKLNFDPQAIFGPAALFGSGAIAFLCLRNPAGAYTMIGYGAAIALISFVAREKEIREKLLLTGLTVAAVISPFGFLKGATPAELGPTLPIFFTLAAAFALLSIRALPKAATILAAVELGLGLCVYLFHVADHAILWQQEVGVLVAGVGLLALVTWALVEAHQHAEGLVLSTYFLCIPILGRLALLTLGEQGLGNTSFVAISFGLLVASLGASVLTRLSKWESAVILLWSVFLLAFGLYGFAVMQQTATLASELTLLTGFGIALIAAALSTVGTQPAQGRNSIWAASSVLGGLLAVRLADLTLTRAPLLLQHPVAGILGACIVVAITASLARAKNIPQLAFVAALFLSGSIFFYWLQADYQALPFGQDVIAVCAMLACVLGTAFTLYKGINDKAPTLYIGSAFGWLLLTRLGYLVLTHANIGIKGGASMSISWTVTALLLIVIGFAARLKELRYMSFVVFAATLMKVLLVDLVGLDPILRVVILMLLGLVMLGGGYWYIRVLRPAEKQA